jgi:MbtH protein
MSFPEEDDDKEYVVVVNHEEQFSIWPKWRTMPPGWRSAGKEGKKSECLQYIDEVWTDMRPLSLRREMEGVRRDGP